MDSFLDYELSFQILTDKKPTKVSIVVEKKDFVPQRRGLRYAYDGILNYPTTHPSVEAANGCSTPAHHPSPSPSLRFSTAGFFCGQITMIKLLHT